MHDKTEYVRHIRNSKLLNYGLVLKKVHRVIKFNQNALLKPYIDMNTDIRIKNKKLWKNYGKCEKKLEMLNLSQHKLEETILCQNRIIMLQRLLQNVY